ncbi:helix-turn-helix transcriptional regulator [Hymenobacter sp. ASUV-10]|uniref:Helix-turn-helix transcriptional regulator n=1 Tax=Hymenobacter aranciens TaxID=3063996 RepID=A0ABT9BEW3_9BACT|nr:helix-turn-helix transcriptional regulator [Hymenobacter sp. ASUV-10]MDO7876795.1 helix-turn-helix transcriptional regulator [Hymenobacter sp. ASUV-10]
MARRARPSLHLLARVRAWLGLRQQELALYLGVSPDLVRRIESGERAFTLPVREAVLPLLPHLPPEGTALDAAPPVALPPATPAPEVAALDLRRRECRQQAARLRLQAEALARQAQVAARWATALPALLAAVSAADPERATWLRDWLTRQARPLPPEAATRYHLLRARATALEAEAAALAEVIADSVARTL